MTAISDRYRRLADGFEARIDAVPDDAWSSPSPCEGWDARQVVGHVVDTHHLFLGFIDEAPPRTASVDDDPKAAWREARAAMEVALDDPALARREYQGHFGPAIFEESVDQFQTNDLLVHAWDLARATGGDERLPADEVTRVHEVLEPMAAKYGDAMRGPGGFGPEVEPPPDADDQDRLLAFLGRDPRA